MRVEIHFQFMVECNSKCSLHKFVSILILSMIPPVKVLYFYMNFIYIFGSIFREKWENCFSCKYKTIEPYFCLYDSKIFYKTHWTIYTEEILVSKKKPNESMNFIIVKNSLWNIWQSDLNTMFYIITIICLYIDQFFIGIFKYCVDYYQNIIDLGKKCFLRVLMIILPKKWKV